jgi:16S rRNA U516 pseudouridylate synthase RsuA-like enzyme
MVQAVGSRVEKLVRVSIGGVELGGLASGASRELSREELRRLGYPGLSRKSKAR